MLPWFPNLVLIHIHLGWRKSISWNWDRSFASKRSCLSCRFGSIAFLDFQFYCISTPTMTILRHQFIGISFPYSWRGPSQGRRLSCSHQGWKEIQAISRGHWPSSWASLPHLFLPLVFQPWVSLTLVVTRVSFQQLVAFPSSLVDVSLHLWGAWMHACRIWVFRNADI